MISDNIIIDCSLILQFQGVQLYIDVFDQDLSPATAPDELVDIILIDLDTSFMGAVLSRRTYTGVFSFVTMDLAVAVRCAGNYLEPQCMECDLGFTGANCETNINECIGVNCSGNGQCVDGINSFTCNCNDGYSGSLCAEGITESSNLYRYILEKGDGGFANLLNFSIAANSLLSSNLLAPVIGGAIGGLILVIFIVAAIVVVIMTLVRRNGNNHMKQMQAKDKDISENNCQVGFSVQ